MFKLYLKSVGVNRLLHCIFDLLRAAGYTAGPQAYPDLPADLRPVGLPELFLSLFSRLGPEIGDDVVDLTGGHMAIGHLVDLNHRRQGAAPQTTHLLKGKLPIVVGVLTLLQSELPHKGVVDLRGPLHMAGGSHTDLDHVFPHGLHPELRIEAGHTVDIGGGDLRLCTDLPQRLLRKVVQLLLDGLQNGNQCFLLPPLLRDDPVHHTIHPFLYVCHLILL